MRKNYPIAEDGWKFVLIPFVVGVIFLLFFAPISWLCFILSAYCAYFFRNPIRLVPKDESIIVAPCDGTVVKVEECDDPDLGKVKKVVVFLSIFNVHITKAPISGEITRYEYYEGKFLDARNDKASDLNEHSLTWMKNDQIEVKVKTIAGLIARRLIPFHGVGAQLHRGEELGLIRFGSRMDFFMPADQVEISVKVGQKIYGSETKLAKILG